MKVDPLTGPAPLGGKVDDDKGRCIRRLEHRLKPLLGQGGHRLLHLLVGRDLF